MKFKRISVLAPFIITLSLGGCATLPADYSVYTADLEFVKSLSTFNAPSFFPPEVSEEDVSEDVSVVLANYHDTGGVSGGGYGSVLKHSRLDAAFDKYCKDNGGVISRVVTVSNRKIHGCSNSGDSFVVIYYIANEKAGFDTGVDLAPFHYIAMYSLGESKIEPIMNTISENYLSFEKKKLSKKLVDYTTLEKADLISALKKIQLVE